MDKHGDGDAECRSDLTLARRERVRELWGLTPRKAAEKLLDEGYGGGTVANTKAKYIIQLSSMRRQVARDRDWWRAKWRRDRSRAKKAAKDPVLREEYLASLETVQAEIEDVLDDRRLKGTPKVQALSELRQIRQAVGKAQGVDGSSRIIADGDDDSSPQVPFLGIVVGVDKLTPDAKRKIDEWQRGDSPDQ
jgi:hypothetical protein